MIRPRAIATLGFGFGALSIVTLGMQAAGGINWLLYRRRRRCTP